MALLDDKARKDIQALLADLEGPVTLVVFTQEYECQYCRETRQIAEEIAELSDQITVRTYDYVQDAGIAESFQIDKIPAIALLGENNADYGVRYYGIPSGYEFSSILHDIKAVAGGPAHSTLSQETHEFLEALEDDLHLQVFVTPTCPYCPAAVILAHAMAIASDRVRADMVEATEFPHLSMKYSVMGVPRTVINEIEFVEGSVPEPMLLAAMTSVLEAK
nr:thioredoxin family protein [Anaerolineae bacterium]